VQELTSKKVIPVLKSNAYGHGIAQVAEILDNRVDLVAVDSVYEASTVSQSFGGEVLIMEYFKPENLRFLRKRQWILTVKSVQDIRALGRKRRKIHLEINTGMNRMGASLNEVSDILDEIKLHKNLTLDGVFTHLADADNALDDNYTKMQIEKFDACVAEILEAGFAPRYIHVAATAGSVKAKSQFANAERLGIGLYGINPLSENDAEFAELAQLKPVLEMTSEIVNVLEIKKGEKVSYNGIFTASHAMKIGVLPVGYFEGLPRELSNKGCVIYGSRKLPILGRVCMNHAMIDISGTDLGIGDEVKVFDLGNNSIEKVCREFGLFSYGVAVYINNSIRRTIV
jgi:alanine racemase